MSHDIEPLSSTDPRLVGARLLTARIQRVVVDIDQRMSNLRDLVREAKETEAHIVLGYASWPAYLADALGKEPLHLAREVRRELVAELSEQGMSTRAIAPIVGVHHDTVATDIRSRALVGNPTGAPERPTFDPMPGWASGPRPSVDEGNPKVTARPVVGLDGKEYQRKVPAPRRTALTKDLHSVAHDLHRLARRLDEIRGDDRLRQNTGALREGLAQQLAEITTSAQALRDALGEDQ